MADLDNVIGNLEGLTWDDWHEWHSDSEVTAMAQDAMALLTKQATEIEKLTNYINGFSRDAVPVVRCRDCVKRPDEHETELNGKSYRYCELHRRWTTDDWFCADGERIQKGDNNDTNNVLRESE